MILSLKRTIRRDGWTLGELSIDGKFECYTLEDTDRRVEWMPQAKLPGETAIPRGAYRVVLSESPKLGYETPELLDVPCFNHIRIHIGNFPSNTEGCILVGRQWSPGSVWKSREAFEALHAKLTTAVRNGWEIWIEIA